MSVSIAKKWNKVSHFMLNNGKEVDYDRAIELKAQKKSDEEIYKLIKQQDSNNERILRQSTESKGREEESRADEKSAQLQIEKVKYILEHQELFSKTEISKAKKVMTSI